MSDNKFASNFDLDVVRKMCNFFALSPGGKAWAGFELRWRIVFLLYDGSKTVTQILDILTREQFRLTQPGVSHHMALLRKLEFVRCEKPLGKCFNYYSLTPEFRQLLDIVRAYNAEETSPL